MTKRKIAILSVLTALFTGLLAGNIYFYYQYKRAQDRNPDIQTARIVNSLKKSVTIPDETPSVLTVVDRTKLTDSQIAKDAQNGDKILLFQKAAMVYIYRPSSEKLVSILSLSTGQRSTAPPATPQPTPAPASTR